MFSQADLGVAIIIFIVTLAVVGLNKIWWWRYRRQDKEQLRRIRGDN